MSWTKVGGPAHSLAIFANRLAALTPDRQAVYMRDPSSGSWKKIGGPADAIIGGGWDLYALSPGGSELWRYDGAQWNKVGGPGAQFAGICNSVYALTPDRKEVYRFNRYTGGWKKIGGPGQTIVEGGSKVYVSAPGNQELWEYSRFTGSWQKIGGPGSMWVGVGGTVFGLTPNKDAVYKYTGTPMNWTKVGGPAESLIGGGSMLYAIQPVSKKLWRYSGKGEQWKEIGTPGSGFVAVDRVIYGMKTDKSEVYQLDDSNEESKRLTSLIYDIFNETEFGNTVVRGFIVKRMGNDILAEHCADVCFQPLSTLKLLPYLHSLIYVEKDSQATLANTLVSWVQPKTGMSGDTPCLDPSDSNNTTVNGALVDVLPTMMWWSHGTMLEALFAKYNTLSITKQAQKLGLNQTEMYQGCPQPDGSVLWSDNISTLIDLAKMFEGVQNKTFLNSYSHRKAFRNNMIELTPKPGTSYTSPITKGTYGPLTNEFLRDIVKEEAAAIGPEKLAIVDSFMQQVSLRGKGGGGGPTGNEWGRSDFLEVTLPFKENGVVVLKKFLVGWYIYQMRSASDSITNPEFQKLESFKREIHRLPIRMAMKTW